MNIFEFQEKYKTGDEKRKALAKMTKEEVDEIIKSCGLPQAKSWIKKLYMQAIEERERG
ncbi:MAG: hypothetical protein IJS71_08345 [Clostridia bacterium]|nr:hypothetical protein [Clostridia bacterium]